MGLVWRAGNNLIYIFDVSFRSHLGTCSLRELIFFALWSAVFAKRNSNYFSCFSHKRFGSGLSESPLFVTQSALCSGLCFLIQTDTSHMQTQMAVNRPFKGLSTKGPWRRNVLPIQVCCSTDLLTLWTCYKLQPLMEDFEPRILVCVLVTAVFDCAVIFIALLCTNHSAAAAPSKTDNWSLVCLVFKYNKFNQSNLKKRNPWKKHLKDVFMELYVEFKRQIP